MGGITGRLYQQFAITIALSVLLSAVNALTLSPALAAMLLKPPTGKKTLLTPFYNGFNKVFGVATNGYISFTTVLVRKFVIGLVLIGVLSYLTVGLVGRIPGGFVPEEDQGYILVNAQLPDSASLERTDAVMKKGEAIMAANHGVEGYNAISGYSLLTGAYSSNMGFYFVALKPWHERHTAEEHANGIVSGAQPGVRPADPGSEPSSRSVRRPFRASARAPASRCRSRIASGGTRIPRRSDRALHAGGAAAAGNRTHLHAVPGPGPAGLCRHRSLEGHEARDTAAGREQRRSAPCSAART